MPHTDELDALTSTPIILRALLRDDPPGRPAGDEDWAPNEVVAHLRDCEERFLQRCRTMLAQENPFLPSFDQEQLARENDYRSANARAALTAFEQMRRQFVDLLAGLSDSAWQRTGRHEEQGSITVETQIRHMVSHDLAHLRQIAESIAPSV